MGIAPLESRQRHFNGRRRLIDVRGLGLVHMAPSPAGRSSRASSWIRSVAFPAPARRLLASKLDHLIRTTRVRDSWMRGHAPTITAPVATSGADHTATGQLSPAAVTFRAVRHVRAV